MSVFHRVLDRIADWRWTDRKVNLRFVAEYRTACFALPIINAVLAENEDGVTYRAALTAYEARRREATAAVVRTNRTTPPDTIIREVWERTGDRPFARIEDVIAPEELGAMLDSYKRVAGYDAATLARA